MERLRLLLLGEFDASFYGQPPVRFPTRKCEALLAYLAVCRDLSHRRDHLATFLWGESTSVQARHSLRQTLTELRAALGSAGRELLLTSSESVALDHRRVHVDGRCFQRILDGRWTPRRQALACTLYKGEFLEGFNGCGAEFDAWVLSERERLTRLAIEAHQGLFQSQFEMGDLAGAMATAFRMAALDPVEEGVHQALMRLYMRRGQFAAALVQYKKCVEVLARELNVQPDEETVALWRQVRAARTATSVEQDWPGPTPLPHIGEGGRASSGIGIRVDAAVPREPWSRRNPHDR